MQPLLEHRAWLRRAVVGIATLIMTACGNGSIGEALPSGTPSAGQPAILESAAPVIFRSLGLTETPGNSDVGTMPGKFAPNFRFLAPNGETLALDAFRGKPVLLNFWATWCGPCRSEMPELQRMHEKLGDQITLLAINLNQSREQITAFFEDLDLTFHVVIDAGQELADDGYMIFGVPSSFLIDAQGVVVAVKIGPYINSRDINTQLEKVGLNLSG